MPEEEPQSSGSKPGFKRFVVFSLLAIVAAYSGTMQFGQFLKFLPLTLLLICPTIYFIGRWSETRRTKNKRD